MPSTPEAIEVFHSAKVLFSPGKASNAGWVATSGLEMSQNSLRLSRTSEEVDERLQNIMKSIHAQCVEYGKEWDFVNYIKWANIAGFKKVADAMIQQGLV
jgi:glutamate dehydrogenase (NADP+)